MPVVRQNTTDITSRNIILPWRGRSWDQRIWTTVFQQEGPEWQFCEGTVSGTETDNQDSQENWETKHQKLRMLELWDSITASAGSLLLMPPPVSIKRCFSGLTRWHSWTKIMSKCPHFSFPSVGLPGCDYPWLSLVQENTIIKRSRNRQHYYKKKSENQN